MKNCSNKNCKQNNPQPFSGFYKNKSKKDGLSSQCIVCEKLCAALYGKTAEWRAADSRRHKKYEKTEKGKANHRRYLQSEKGKIGHCTRQAKRRAAKLNATPKWLNDEHLRQIEQFYIEANKLTIKTGIEHHVDHIIPLQNNKISGLHVPWNLQVLVGPGPNGNQSKGNKVNV